MEALLIVVAFWSTSIGRESNQFRVTIDEKHAILMSLLHHALAAIFPRSDLGSNAVGLGWKNASDSVNIH